MRLLVRFATGIAITVFAFDYHCHIPPADIAGNIHFKNLPLSKRLYSAKISRALWLVRISG
jgi:hypothetical protein